ncbi:MAG: 3-hydroxy-5-phosphonooxypentane-2,4-dione thiolase LsrF [Spirochaetales bacterium]|jgi:putative autoinducer-2 (AI-2) aldolase|nr:3-hydroxy-5-phosphonooxypentane-2,4-dione thiolase LsrF [Spirochaetales bacterium]
MSFGKKIRMSRIFRGEPARTVMLALDHGMALGPMKGIERPRELLNSVGKYVDSIMLNKGILTNCGDPSLGAGVVLRISGASTIAGPDLTAERITTTLESAIRLGADAVAVSIFVGTPNEHASIEALSLLADECDRFGIPLLAVTALGKDREKGFDPRYLALAVRVAAEMGADMIKTYFCEDGFEKVIESAAGIPVVIAGGPKMDNDISVLETAQKAVKSGCRGVDMGRNVWQNEDPIAMLKALRAIIHENASAKDALLQYWK